MKGEVSMKHSRFSEEQIIAMLKDNEAGAKVDDLYHRHRHRHSVSGATFYAWRKKVGGMEPSDAKRLPKLETANVKLKRIVVDRVLDVSAMKELLQKHW
jgi:putative transposase